MNDQAIERYVTTGSTSQLSIGQNIFSGCTSLNAVVFKNRTAGEISALENIDSIGIDSSKIRTWNEASQEWVSEQVAEYANAPLRYALVTAQLQDAGDSLSCAVDDQTITTIGISSDETPIIIQLPEASNAGARDFILRVEISSSTAPSFTFQGVDESIEFDSDDDDWAVLEPGLNIVSFTETKRAMGGGQ